MKTRRTIGSLLIILAMAGIALPQSKTAKPESKAATQPNTSGNICGAWLGEVHPLSSQPGCASDVETTPTIPNNEQVPRVTEHSESETSLNTEEASAEASKQHRRPYKKKGSHRKTFISPATQANHRSIKKKEMHFPRWSSAKKDVRESAKSITREVYNFEHAFESAPAFEKKRWIRQFVLGIHVDRDKI
jgi:hypothetical protein